MVKRRVKKTKQKRKTGDHDRERSIETKTERRGERGVMEVKKFAEGKKQKKREE